MISSLLISSQFHKFSVTHTDPQARSKEPQALQGDVLPVPLSFPKGRPTQPAVCYAFFFTLLLSLSTSFFYSGLVSEEIIEMPQLCVYMCVFGLCARVMNPHAEGHVWLWSSRWTVSQLVRLICMPVLCCDVIVVCVMWCAAICLWSLCHAGQALVSGEGTTAL